MTPFGPIAVLPITLIIWLYDVYKPVHDVRFDPRRRDRTR